MNQSVLEPNGAEAERIADLALMLFGGAAIIFFGVMAVAAASVWGGVSVRRAIASERMIAAAGIAFPVITLTALLFYSLWLMRANIQGNATPPAGRIEVAAEQWWWRITYVEPDGRRISEANELRLPVGREVELVLTSPDVIHSLWIPAIGGKLDMIPGRTNRMRVSIDRPGIYRAQCAEYCGGPHALMAFDVIALEATEFDAWVRGDAAGGSTEAVRGREIFEESGCGSCHAVRGANASGLVGPDLSRVGGRRTIAAGTLPTSRENLTRFIVDGQSIKPGNLMPPFGLFAAEDVDAISAYLMSLR
jgi:cytochrome c oxidase subunit II